MFRCENQYHHVRSQKWSHLPVLWCCQCMRARNGWGLHSGRHGLVHTQTRPSDERAWRPLVLMARAATYSRISPVVL